MDTTHVSAALASFTALIVEAANSTDPKRYRNIMKLCQLADQMLRMGNAANGTRVRDFGRPEPGGLVAGVFQPDEPAEDMAAQYVGYGAGLIQGGYAGGEQADMTRQMVMAALPMLQGYQKHSEARARADRARELDTIVATLDTLKGQKDQGGNVDKLQKRVDELIETMTKEEQHDNVVSADVLRRHSTGEPGRQGDEGRLREADAAGGGGDASVVSARAQEGLGIGEARRAASEAVGGLDRETDRDVPECENNGRPEDPFEAPEARPQNDLGGPV
jgi:hypothetical protein